MIEGVKVFDLKKYTDERGWLAEIYREDEFSYRPAMVYVSYTNPGVTRGPHEHKHQADLFVCLGPGEFKIYMWDNRKDSSTYGQKMELVADQNQPKAVLVPAGIVHGYKCISKEMGAVINMPDKLYRGQGKKEEVDEIRHEEDPDSKFKID